MTDFKNLNKHSKNTSMSDINKCLWTIVYAEAGICSHTQTKSDNDIVYKVIKEANIAISNLIVHASYKVQEHTLNLLIKENIIKDKDFDMDAMVKLMDEEND